jgi:hypothetical protein
VDERSRASGLAALAICESMLLSLKENGVIDDAEAAAILTDAAAGLAPEGICDADHKAAAELIELILRRTGSGQRTSA